MADIKENKLVAVVLKKLSTIIEDDLNIEMDFTNDGEMIYDPVTTFLNLAQDLRKRAEVLETSDTVE